MNLERIPLQTKLKRELHRKIAYAQDLIVEEVYRHFPKAVLHGGTAIWRVYSGKRFSEDLDFYLPKNEEKANELFKDLENKGFKIIKKKISENSIYSELIFDRTSVRLEATFQKVQGALSNYESSDGNFIAIYSLTAEEFLIEKAKTYLKRQKIRDLWDIFFLLREIPKLLKSKEVLKQLITSYNQPVDENNLKSIILEGVVPSSKKMLEYIKIRWQRENI